MDARQKIHGYAREVVGSLVDGSVDVELRPQAEPVLAAVPPEEPVPVPTCVRIHAFLHQGVATGVEVELREFGIVRVAEFAPVPVDGQVDARSDRLQLPWRETENGRSAAPMLQTHLTHADESHRFLVIDDVLQLADPGQIVFFCGGFVMLGNEYLAWGSRHTLRSHCLYGVAGHGRRKVRCRGLRGECNGDLADRLCGCADLAGINGLEHRGGRNGLGRCKRRRRRYRFFGGNDPEQWQLALRGRLPGSVATDRCRRCVSGRRRRVSRVISVRIRGRAVRFR
jgi:hypothetical protein